MSGPPVGEDPFYGTALAICGTQGFPVDPALDPRLGWMWDGRVGAVRGQRASDVIHDLAHWLICPPTRLSLPDFGLSEGPESGNSCDLLVERSAALDEERRASVLGILIERSLGMPWRETLRMHNWTVSCEDLLLGEEVLWLESRGLLHGGWPTFL